MGHNSISTMEFKPGIFGFHRLMLSSCLFNTYLTFTRHICIFDTEHHTRIPQMKDVSSAMQFSPRLLRREDGGWLAVSPDDAPLHIGVSAWSADDAQIKFDRELREWVALLSNNDQ